MNSRRLDTNKTKILKSLRELWKKYPNQRFGQLLENFIFHKDTMFHQDDKLTEEILKNMGEIEIEFRE